MIRVKNATPEISLIKEDFETRKRIFQKNCLRISIDSTKRGHTIPIKREH